MTLRIARSLPISRHAPVACFHLETSIRYGSAVGYVTLVTSMEGKSEQHLLGSVNGKREEISACCGVLIEERRRWSVNGVVVKEGKNNFFFPLFIPITLLFYPCSS